MAAAMAAIMGATALLVLKLLVCASATVHTVGDSNGWSPGVDYRTWATDKTFAVGDTLVFNYGGGFHSVQEVSSTGYASCTTGNALTSDSSGSTAITLKTAGAHYFVCGALGHCNQGMKLAVTVGAATAAAGSAGTAPPLPVGSTEGTAPPLPAGGTEGTAPPLPAGGTEGTAPPFPAASTEGTAPPLPAGGSEGTTPPLPVGEGITPTLPVGEGITPTLPTTGETPRTRTFGTPSTPSLTTLDTIPQASSTGMTSPSAAAFVSAAAMLLFALP